MNLIRAGSSILLAQSPFFRPHLWLVLCDPQGNPPRVVAVMLRTVTKFTDLTVVLSAGDHPFIRYDSAVHYSTARWFSVTALMHAVKSGQCHLKADMSRALLARARQGLKDSPFTVHALRKECGEIF